MVDHLFFSAPERRLLPTLLSAYLFRLRCQPICCPCLQFPSHLEERLLNTAFKCFAPETYVYCGTSRRRGCPLFRRGCSGWCPGENNSRSHRVCRSSSDNRKVPRGMADIARSRSQEANSPKKALVMNFLPLFPAKMPHDNYN